MPAFLLAFPVLVRVKEILELIYYFLFASLLFSSFLVPYILSFYILRGTFVTCKFITLMLSFIKRQDLMHFLLYFWSEISRIKKKKTNPNLLAGCISNIYPLNLSFIITFSPELSHFFRNKHFFHVRYCFSSLCFITGKNTQKCR